MWVIGAILEFIIAGYFIFFKLKEDKAQILWKSIASAGFVLLGCGVLFLQNIDAYTNIILIGLFVGAIGDYLLARQYIDKEHKKIYFLLGLSAFTFGHVAYSLAFYQGSVQTLFMMLGICIVLATITVFILGKLHLQFKEMKIAVWIYCGIIYFMEIQALLLLGQCNIAHIVLNIGTLFFVLSDLILAFIYFKNMDTMYMNRWNLTFYYLAQLLIVMHLYLR